MQIIQPKSKRVRVPAGLYLLGDPCYGVPDCYWDELLVSCDYFQGQPVGIVDGKSVLGFDTGGDGTYYDQFGTAYGVDAGLLGLVPFIEGWTENDGGGAIINFPTDFDCYTDGKVLVFGTYQIDTDPQEDENEDDEDDENY